MWRPCEREFNWRYFLGIYLILISFSCFFYRSCVSTSDPAPPPTRSKIQVAVPLQLNQRLITLEGCNKNDLVFVVWNIRHGQFVVVQDSHTLYFVHADSLPGLNLTPPPPAPLLSEASNELALTSNQIPVPYYGIGRVIDKEYCQARKVSHKVIYPNWIASQLLFSLLQDENRYRVAKGSKFYRIKLAPIPSRTFARRERTECKWMIARTIYE